MAVECLPAYFFLSHLKVLYVLSSRNLLLSDLLFCSKLYPQKSCTGVRSSSGIRKTGRAALASPSGWTGELLLSIWYIGLMYAMIWMFVSPHNIDVEILMPLRGIRSRDFWGWLGHEGLVPCKKDPSELPPLSAKLDYKKSGTRRGPPTQPC